MNVDLLIMLIILYIIKNNNSQYLYHTRNPNQNSSIPVVPINERKPFLSNNYNHTNLINNKNRDYMYYPNYPLKNVNSTKNTSMNNNKNSTIKDINIINTIADKNNIINKDNSIIDTNSIKDNPNYIKSTSKVNSINENSIIDNDKDHAISNSENSNQIILKNKFIKSSTKTPNRSLTYNNLYKKDYTININNTFNQLQLSKGEINKDDFIKNLNPSIQKPVTDFKTNVPVLIGSTNITEIFHGKINFSTPIISIQKVTNELFITNKSLLPTLHCNNNNNNSILYYEGFLKTQLEYLKDVVIQESEITCDSKYYIMFIPFSGSKYLNLNDEIINSPNIILQDFTLDINKSTFSIDNPLEEPVKGNKYINLYKLCNLTVKVNCHISLYRKKLVQL